MLLAGGQGRVLESVPEILMATATDGEGTFPLDPGLQTHCNPICVSSSVEKP